MTVSVYSSGRRPSGLRKPWRLAIITVVAVLAAACGAATDDGDTDTDAGDTDASTDADSATDAGEDTDADAAGSDELLKISYVSPIQDITDSPGQSLIGMRERLAELGVEYEEFTGVPPVFDDMIVYNRLLEDQLTIDPDYLVVYPGASWEETFPRLVEIDEAGIKIVAVQVNNPKPDEYPFDAITYVSVPEYEMGFMAGEDAAADACALGRDPVNLAMFHGPVTNEIAQARANGFLTSLGDGLAECDITLDIQQQVYTNFNRELSFNTAERVMSGYPDINVIFGANSNAAMGVLAALNGMQLEVGGEDGVWIVGQGGQLDELAAICTGDIITAPFRNPRDMGDKIAEAIAADLAGEEVEPIFFTDLFPVRTCDDVFETVPRPMLDTEPFRGNIPPELWDELSEQYPE